MKKLYLYILLAVVIFILVILGYFGVVSYLDTQKDLKLKEIERIKVLEEEKKQKSEELKIKEALEEEENKKKLEENYNLEIDNSISKYLDDLVDDSEKEEIKKEIKENNLDFTDISRYIKAKTYKYFISKGFYPTGVIDYRQIITDIKLFKNVDFDYETKLTDYMVHYGYATFNKVYTDKDKVKIGTEKIYKFIGADLVEKIKQHYIDLGNKEIEEIIRK